MAAPDRWGVCVLSPPWEAADLFILKCLEHAVCVCAHVSGDWYTNAPAWRLQWLAQYTVLSLPLPFLEPGQHTRRRRAQWLVLGPRRSSLRRVVRLANLNSLTYKV